MFAGHEITRQEIAGHEYGRPIMRAVRKNIRSVEKAGRGGAAPMALVQITPAVPHQGPHKVPQCTKTTTYRRAIDASCGPAM